MKFSFPIPNRFSNTSSDEAPKVLDNDISVKNQQQYFMKMARESTKEVQFKKRKEFSESVDEI